MDKSGTCVVLSTPKESAENKIKKLQFAVFLTQNIPCDIIHDVFNKSFALQVDKKWGAVKRRIDTGILEQIGRYGLLVSKYVSLFPVNLC